jgi:CRP-like cAMP-binding protein
VGQTTVRAKPQPGVDLHERVRLLDVEPDLSAGLPDEELEFARGYLVVPALQVGSAGGPRLRPMPEDTIAALVMDGLLVCDSQAFGRPTARIFGAGDMFDPLLIDARNTWRAIAHAHVAVLDERFVLAARRWPQILRAFTCRLLQSHEELQLRTTIVAMPRVEERVLALLSHLAVRWGRVTPNGLTLDLPVTHLLLGRLVGARRPTVSLALATLREQQLLDRDRAGLWVLPSAARNWPAEGVPDGRAVAPVAQLRVNR